MPHQLFQSRGDKKFEQVAQRATIAHLTASHQNILNSSQEKDFSNWSWAANSAVHGWIRPNFKLIRDYIVVLVTCKNEEDPIKNEGARMLTSLLFDFSDAQGQLTLVSGGIPRKFELIQAFIVVLITCKNKKDPIMALEC